MNALVLMLIPATVGVDFGWSRQPDQSIEYIVQVKPEEAAYIYTGSDAIDRLRPELSFLKNRYYRLNVSNERLPNQGVLPAELGGTATPNISNTGSYSGTGNYTGTTSGNNGNLYPINTPTSTGGFQMENKPSTYPPNTNNQYLVGLPPPPSTLPTSTYPANTYPNNTYNNTYTNTSSTNPYGSTNAPPYNTAAYTQPTNNYQPPYNTNSYQQPYGAQQNYQQPYNPNYAPQQPQYLAALPPALYNDPHAFGAAKPNIADPANPAATGNFANSNPYNNQLNGAPPAGSFQPQQQYYAGGVTNPGTLPAGGVQGMNPQTTAGFNNVGGAGVEPKSATDTHQQTAATKDKEQAQTATTSFAWLFVVLFLSIGANICFGYANFNLRERCRILMVDRAAY